VAYDPAFAFEIAHIVKDGLRRMYGEDSEDLFYYLTVYNEPVVQPAEPDNADVEGILKGMHLWSRGEGDGPRVQLLASGVAVPWAMKAQGLLNSQWGVAADVWSVTSWNELRRDGLAAQREALLDPGAPARVPYVTQRLSGTEGPVVAVSDYMRAVQDQIQPFVPGDFMSLGTDGWGLSDTRGALRRHFLVDAESITVQALALLARQGQVDPSAVAEAAARYKLDDPGAADAGNTEGGG
jgi:pyruvate dehydrogenase E1 component